MSTEIKSGPHAERWAIEVVEKDGSFEASLPFRQIVCLGSTRERALGALVEEYCQLSRRGSFNPNDPNRIGACAQQHAMEILQEELARHIDQRFTDWQQGCHSSENFAAALENEATAGGAWTRDPRFLRRNEVISGIATAIAALARIREL